MEFKNLHADINCDCVVDCSHEPETLFALKTPEKSLSELDFKSYWDLGRREKKNNGCNATCALKAQSISIINDENQNVVKNIYQEIFKITPGYYGPYYTIVKFKDECGLTKASPSTRNPYHYDFYKCDEFKLENVELVSSVNLHEENV